MKAFLLLFCVIPLGCQASALTPDDAGDAGPVPEAGVDADTTLGTWSRATSGTDRDLYRVRGSGPDDVWAVGTGGIILHWNGAAWSGVPSGTTEDLFDLWVSGPRDVWAFGATDTILHWDGAAWSAVPSGTGRDLNGVWGSGPDDIWAVGADCSSVVSGGQTKNSCAPDNILHWDGALWSVVASGTSQALYGAWGSGPDDVWAVGEDCWSIDTADMIETACSPDNLMHWNGTAWSVLTTSWGGPAVDLWGSGPSDIWALVLGYWTIQPTLQHWDGSAWSARILGSNMNGIWGSGADDVWAVGAGDIQHWDGTDWSASTSGASLDLLGVWGSGPGDVWAVGYAGTIVHRGMR
jgi:hypothetical protein